MVVVDDGDYGATEQARVVVVVERWSVGDVMQEGGGYRGGWRLRLRHGDGMRDGKLGLGS